MVETVGNLFPRIDRLPQPLGAEDDTPIGDARDDTPIDDAAQDFRSLDDLSKANQSDDRMKEVDTGSNAVANSSEAIDVRDIDIDMPLTTKKGGQTLNARTALRQKIEQISVQAKIEEESVFDDISHISERYSRPLDQPLPMHLQNMEFLPVDQLQRDDDQDVKMNIKQRRAELKRKREEAKAPK